MLEFLSAWIYEPCVKIDMVNFIWNSHCFTADRKICSNCQDSPPLLCCFNNYDSIVVSANKQVIFMSTFLTYACSKELKELASIPVRG